jgi:predicted membrane protein
MFIQELLTSLTEAPAKFIDVALHDPISAVLVAVAAVILIASLGFFAVLVLGAIADLVTPSSGGQRHQPGQ